jgi:branched-chain amino acid transport system ATP-binding protein
MTARLAVEDITVSFGGLTAVAAASFTVAEGERVGLIGPNGAGKTTLVNTIAGEIRPNSGTVSIGGVDITGLKPFRRFRNGLARTFQVAHPFPALSVLDAVILGPLSKGATTATAEGAAIEALVALGRMDDARKTMSELNPVSAKLVELARIVASKPSVVLLDELLAGLLPSERHRVLDTLAEVSASNGWATVMIEHLIGDIRRFCDRVVVLVQGAVLADGPTDEVLADPRVIGAYLGSSPSETTPVTSLTLGLDK